MEPISSLLMLGAGLIFKGVGTGFSMSGAADANEATKKKIGLEQDVEAQRHQAMILDNHRRSLENIRQMQRAHAMALTTATSQGAAQGSALPGAYGQISGQGNWNALGLNQNLQIGENIFGLNSQISQQKLKLADANQQMQLGQGLSKFGGDLLGAQQPFGRLFSGFGTGGGVGKYGGGGVGAQGPTLSMLS